MRLPQDSCPSWWLLTLVTASGSNSILDQLIHLMRTTVGTASRCQSAWKRNRCINIYMNITWSTGSSQWFKFKRNIKFFKIILKKFPKWLLRSIFALFPEQLLNGLVSRGSPGKYSMIYCFLGDALGVLFCRFWSTVLPFGARLPIHTLDYWTV